MSLPVTTEEEEKNVNIEDILHICAHVVVLCVFLRVSFDKVKNTGCLESVRNHRTSEMNQTIMQNNLTDE